MCKMKVERYDHPRKKRFRFLKLRFEYGHYRSIYDPNLGVEGLGRNMSIWIWDNT